jgi:hypothetical protein
MKHEVGSGRRDRFIVPVTSNITSWSVWAKFALTMNLSLRTTEADVYWDKEPVPVYRTK